MSSFMQLQRHSVINACSKSVEPKGGRPDYDFATATLRLRDRVSIWRRRKDSAYPVKSHGNLKPLIGKIALFSSGYDTVPDMIRVP